MSDKENKKENIKEKEKKVKNGKKLLTTTFVVWIVVIFLSYYYYNLNAESKIINTIATPKKVPKSDSKKMENIVLFYPQGDKMIRVDSQIPHYYKTRDKIFALINSELELLYNKKIISNNNIEINNIYINGNIAYIDMTKNFSELGKQDKKSVLAIYSLVDAVVNNNKISGVKFLIDKKEDEGVFSKIYEKNIKNI